MFCRDRGMPAPDAPASSTDRPTARVLDEPTECEIDPSVGGLPGGCVWWVLPLRGRRGARQHFHCAPQQGRRVHTHCTRDLSSYTQSLAFLTRPGTSRQSCPARCRFRRCAMATALVKVDNRQRGQRQQRRRRAAIHGAGPVIALYSRTSCLTAAGPGIGGRFQPCTPAPYVGFAQ